MSGASKRSGLPFDIEPMTGEEDAKIKKDFLAYEEHGLGRITTKVGWVMGGRYIEDGWAEAIYNFELRDDDVWIASYPKTGTTWSQKMLYMILNGVAADVSVNFANLFRASPFLEYHSLPPRKKLVEIMETRMAALKSDDPLRPIFESEIEFMNTDSVKLADELPRSSRRLLKTHLPFEMCPPDMFKRNKVVYVARDPREVVVSYYHHCRLLRHQEFVNDFPTFCQYFLDDQLVWSPFWEHILQAWRLRDHPNMLFIFFEDLKKDLKGVVKKAADFLGVQREEAEIDEIVANLSFAKLKESEGTEMALKLGVFKENEGSFVRSGKLGGWKNYLTEDELVKMEAWTDKFLANEPELKAKLFAK